jgi:hypothetical protein
LVSDNPCSGLTGGRRRTAACPVRNPPRVNIPLRKRMEAALCYRGVHCGLIPSARRAMLAFMTVR